MVLGGKRLIFVRTEFLAIDELCSKKLIGSEINYLTLVQKAINV